jgi:hypothetical protein
VCYALASPELSRAGIFLSSDRHCVEHFLASAPRQGAPLMVGSRKLVVVNYQDSCHFFPGGGMCIVAAQAVSRYTGTSAHRRTAQSFLLLRKQLSSGFMCNAGRICYNA